MKKCTSEIREAKKKGMRGNKGPAMSLGERVSTIEKCNHPKLPNTTFMMVIHWVSNGMDMVLAPKNSKLHTQM